MSGGSYDYIFSKLSNECEGRMYDAEMNDLITDLCEVLHELEWWQSGDTSEEHYRKTLTKFKAKWFKGDRQKRLKGYIDEQIGIVRSQLYYLIGESQESKSIESQVERDNRKIMPWYLEPFKQVIETFGSNNNTLEWLGKNCKDCGNEKCKISGTLPKGYDCALWQPKNKAESEPKKQMSTRELKTESFKIANEKDKNEFFDKMHRIVSHAIFEELINKQHHHLNITISIEAVDDDEA